MTIDTNDKLNSILRSIADITFIKSDDIPNIDLYMDQVTTFMDEQLAKSKRYPDDKILTKTMINNYAKNNLLPPPDKKKYSREHMLLLIFIYYFKNILTIKDIQTLLNPLTESYFGKKDQNFTIKDLYDSVFSFESEEMDRIMEDIRETYARVEDSFADVSENQDFIKIFTFISMLSFDVYVKKQLIETLIDMVSENNEAKASKEKSSKEQKPHPEARS